MERLRTAGPIEYKLADEAGNLDRPLRVDPWSAPGLNLKDGRLEVDGRHWPGRLVTPKPPMLEKFVQLGVPGRESGQAVLAYARKWGLLNLCQHHLPLGHEDLQVPISFAVTGPDRYTLALPDPCKSFWVLGGEPVSTWFYWSRQAAAILAIVSRLREGEWARKVDWSMLGEEGPWMAGAPETLGGRRSRAELWTRSLEEGYMIDASVADAERARREVERGVARGAIETWLRLAGVAFELRWPSHGNPRVGFQVNGLFGALGLQLLQAAADSTGFAFCAGCTNLIAPHRGPGRRPRFCAECQARHIPQKLADEKRQKEKEKKKLESASASEGQAPTVG
jgi:hypothetical protein